MKIKQILLLASLLTANYSNVAAQDKQDTLSSPTAEDSKHFLENNKKMKGIVVMPSGLQYKVIKEGKGAKPVSTDRISINYTLAYINGKIIDEDFKNTVWDHHIDKALPGMREAILNMPVGSRRIIYLPANLAFGDSDQSVPPGSTIVCDIALLKAYK